MTEVRPPTGGLAQWLAARARNALRRPLRIGGVSALVFLTALLTLVLIPRQASRAARLLTPSAAEYPDTAQLIRRTGSADSVTRAADSAVARIQVRAARVAAADTLPSALAARRDSLAAEDAELARGLQRVEMSPLAASYRALAAMRELRGDPHVALLIDSLADVERARVAFGEAGGVDPIYVALTARLNAIGRSIVGIAEDRRNVVHEELARLGGSASGPAVAAAMLRARAHQDSVARVDSIARAELIEARQTVTILQARAERARQLVNVSAPPIDLLAAAFVLGAALGFAVTFGVEVWRPRVADGGEAERVSGVRTLAVLAPPALNPERARRSTDRTLSPLIDALSTEYRLLYLGLAGTGLPLVTVTGDESDVVATVAANIAVAGALDSRSTLLVDADPRVAAATGIVAARLAPGVSDVLAGTVSWPEAIVPVVVGRERSLDVIPAGGDPRAAWPAQGSPLSAESLRAELSRLARRYDLLVIAAPAGLAQVGPDSVLPGPDVVLTARIAYTTLARLAAAAAALRTSGMHLRGVVLWNADSAPVAPHRRTYSRSGSLPTATGALMLLAALVGCAHRPPGAPAPATCRSTSSHGAVPYTRALAPMLVGSFYITVVDTTLRPPMNEYHRQHLRLADSTEHVVASTRRLGHLPRRDLQLVGSDSVFYSGKPVPGPSEVDAGVLYIGCRDCNDGWTYNLVVHAMSQNEFWGRWDFTAGIGERRDAQGHPLPDPAGYYCAVRSSQ